MAKQVSVASAIEPTVKATRQGRGNIKTSSMTKYQKRSHKKYRGQG